MEERTNGNSLAAENILSPDSRPINFSVSGFPDLRTATKVPNNTPATSSLLQMDAQIKRHTPVVPDDVGVELVSAALSQLGKITEQAGTFVDSLPPDVRRRVGALLRVDARLGDLMAEYAAEQAALLQKHEQVCASLYTRRRDIVSGTHEPTDAECLPGAESTEESEASKSPVSGVPSFWTTVIQETDDISFAVQEHDEELVDSIQNITSQFIAGTEDAGEGFVVTFDFAPNDLIEDKTLSIKFMYNPGDASMLHHAEGSEIHWKDGKNLTVQFVTHTQRHAKSGKQRVVSKRVPRDSFFRIFSPPTIEAMSAAQDAGKDDELDSMEGALHMAYEVCQTLRQKVVPNAAKIFTGCYEKSEEEEL